MSTSTSGSVRRSRWRGRRALLILACVLVLAAGGAVGIRALWDVAKSHLGSTDGCSAGGYQLDTGQAEVAATMVGTVARFSPTLPERASVLVLAAALQESKLENLKSGEGDRDSVGVLQQRPSQGWGRPEGSATNPAVLNNVRLATRLFLDALVKVQGWRTGDLATVIQAVQISADGSAYAKHEPEATALAQALDGNRAAAITCDFGAPKADASPAQVATLIRGDLPVHAPTVTADTVRVAGAHWQTAAWFVAYSHRLGIEHVSYAGQTWTRSSGWHSSAAPTTAVLATLYSPK